MEPVTSTLIVEFKKFPKIYRYSRDVVVTEKIDGTNAAVIIDGGKFVGAQSRSRLITPEVDNYGFAKWAYTNGERLAELLGDGVHFGEWWGNGIQRGYGLANGDKRFYLFNVSKWRDLSHPDIGLGCVPVLWEGNMDTLDVLSEMNSLARSGSRAAEGFNNPEGIVIFHTQGNFMLKKTFEKDDAGKTHGV